MQLLKYPFLSLLLLVCLALKPSPAMADEITLRVAVASNFISTARQLSERFTDQTGIQIKLSSASTGKLTAQIEAGAPFDLFLSADTARPERLVESGLALTDSLAVYAIGQLVLVSRQPIQLEQLLQQRMAVANPKTAPYGLAAEQWLAKQAHQPQRIMGENINQTWHFFQVGGVQSALVAKSQLAQSSLSNLHTLAIESDAEVLQQGMVILARSSLLEASQQFHDYLLSAQSQQLIQASGYLLYQPSG
jgi:molybdate transport system substrate-binding protein